MLILSFFPLHSNDFRAEVQTNRSSSSQTVERLRSFSCFRLFIDRSFRFLLSFSCCSSSSLYPAVEEEKNRFFSVRTVAFIVVEGEKQGEGEKSTPTKRIQSIFDEEFLQRDNQGVCQLKNNFDRDTIFFIFDLISLHRLMRKALLEILQQQKSVRSRSARLEYSQLDIRCRPTHSTALR